MERQDNAATNRMDELREAAEPLRAYLKKYGDPYTSVIVTQASVTENQAERFAMFAPESDAEIEKEIRQLMEGVGDGSTG